MQPDSAGWDVNGFARVGRRLLQSAGARSVGT